jgi:hypothetical protein
MTKIKEAKEEKYSTEKRKTCRERKVIVAVEMIINVCCLKMY